MILTIGLWRKKALLRAAVIFCLVLLNLNLLIMMKHLVSSSNGENSNSSFSVHHKENSFLLESSHRTLALLAANIRRLNDDQQMWIPKSLKDRAYEVLPEDVVIVVQVHSRVSYLRKLIASLRSVVGIERALLVFSHDIFSEEINTAVLEAADFARVVQIFYSHSLQLNPDQFPGTSARDCARNMSRTKAVLSNCTNAAFPDQFGHYREAKYTQTKHHWWWKMNRVFDQLKWTKNHSGLFLFLEEDHYVTPDCLHVLKMLQSARSQQCTSCSVLSLGTYKKHVNYLADSAKVEISDWFGWRHNMGMALDQNTWRHLLKPCARHFCLYDDYNWDWSLQHVSITPKLCLSQPLKVMMMVVPRVYHIGECGVHHHSHECEHSYSVVASLVAGGGHWLFPLKLGPFSQPSDAVRRRMKKAEANGGWADPRDHQLCLSFVNTLKTARSAD